MTVRRLYHVARADFLQRIRSRRLLIVFAVVAFLGYLVNVGGIHLVYQVGEEGTVVQGVNTAAFVGLKSGLTGSLVFLLGGFYLMNSTLTRDRRNGVTPLVASTTISNHEYLLAKWLSNVAFAAVLLVVLGVATIVNHVVHGVGGTRLVPLLTPLVVIGLPVGAFVGAVSVLFETVDRLRGTLGNALYFFGVVPLMAGGLVPAAGLLPGEIPIWTKAVDVFGSLSAYELTLDSLLAVAPDYAGGPPSFGTISPDGVMEPFRYDGGPWPTWIFLQRAGLVLAGIVVVGVGTLSFDRLATGESDGRDGPLRRFVEHLRERIRTADADPEPTGTPIESITTTPVTDRNAGGFSRLLAAEIRLALRGRAWWWYVGAVGLCLAPVVVVVQSGATDASVADLRRIGLPLAFIWPVFVWGEMGGRTARLRTTKLVLSSNYPHRQLLAEWAAGVVVALAIGIGFLALSVVTGSFGAGLAILAGSLFGPSLALAAGIWSRSTVPFEMSYLLLWYVGPLNGASALDFVGATGRSVELGVPFAFAGVSPVLVAIALARRRIERG